MHKHNYILHWHSGLVRFSAFAIVAMIMAVPGFCAPAKELSPAQIKARYNVPSASLTCNTGLINNNDGASLYTFMCIHVYGCQHSIAPQTIDNEFIGSCLNCPGPFAEAGGSYAGCLIVADPW